MRGVFREGFWRSSLHFLEFFFQFTRVFEEKNPKTPPKFSRPYKHIYYYYYYYLFPAYILI